MPATPMTPDANSRMLLGSGVVPEVLVVVLLDPQPTVNVSEGIEPTVFACAMDGQPGEVHPAPLFTSQKVGSPLGTLAFCRVSQKFPLPSVGPLKLPDSLQTSNPKLLAKQFDWVRPMVPSNRVLPNGALPT